MPGFRVSRLVITFVSLRVRNALCFSQETVPAQTPTVCRARLGRCISINGFSRDSMTVSTKHQNESNDLLNESRYEMSSKKLRTEGQQTIALQNLQINIYYVLYSKSSIEVVWIFQKILPIHLVRLGSAAGSTPWEFVIQFDFAHVRHKRTYAISAINRHVRPPMRRREEFRSNAIVKRNYIVYLLDAQPRTRARARVINATTILIRRTHPACGGAVGGPPSMEIILTPKLGSVHTTCGFSDFGYPGTMYEPYPVQSVLKKKKNS